MNELSATDLEQTSQVSPFRIAARARRAIESATYVHGIVLVEFGVGVDLAHENENGRGAIEERVTGSLVGLPGIDEMRNALLEDFAVNLDVGHDGRLTVQDSPDSGGDAGRRLLSRRCDGVAPLKQINRVDCRCREVTPQPASLVRKPRQKIPGVSRQDTDHPESVARFSRWMPKRFFSLPQAATDFTSGQALSRKLVNFRVRCLFRWLQSPNIFDDLIFLMKFDSQMGQ